MLRDTLGNTFSSFNDEMIDCTVNGECSQCGGCCSNRLPLTDSEIRSIKHYINLHKIKPHVVGIPIANTSIIDITCPFLATDRQTNRCNIYEVRPSICRKFLCTQKGFEDYFNDEEFMKEERHIINMRETFFPSKKNKY